jgi:hypothetical protein
MSTEQLTEVVSFRISPQLLARLDKLAESETRSRGNMIMVQLYRSVGGIDAVARRLESLVKVLHEEELRNPDSPQAEYWRGALHDTKWLLGVFCGERVREEVLTQVRRKTKLPIPHVVRLDQDGNRYGLDTDAG